MALDMLPDGGEVLGAVRGAIDFFEVIAIGELFKQNRYKVGYRMIGDVPLDELEKRISTVIAEERAADQKYANVSEMAMEQLKGLQRTYRESGGVLPFVEDKLEVDIDRPRSGAVPAAVARDLLDIRMNGGTVLQASGK